MRILAIRGARLASLDAPFEVDLTSEPLRSAGVFAITGPTGAGKSSLLDALCLALFANTPRLARTPGQRLDARGADEARAESTLAADDPRTLVREGALDAFAEVDFVGVDGRVHRARWSVVRTRTKRPFGARLRAAQCTLLDVASGQLVAGGKREVLAAIEAKLGLGFGQLQRSVLLPQNEFAAFLEADADERAVLLERATGAEIFGEIAKVVHERAAAAKREREASALAVEALAVLSDAELEALEGRHRNERIASAQSEEHLADLVRRRERLDALRVLRDEERAAIDAERAVEAQLALVETARADVALLDRAAPIASCLAEATRAADELARCRQASETARRDESDGRARALAARADHQAAMSAVARSRDEVEQSRERVSRARELEAAMRADQAALEGARAAHAEAAKTFGAVTESVLRLGAERGRAEVESTEATRVLSEAEALTGGASEAAIEERLSELRRASARLLGVEAELERGRHELVRLEARRVELDALEVELERRAEALAVRRAALGEALEAAEARLSSLAPSTLAPSTLAPSTLGPSTSGSVDARLASHGERLGRAIDAEGEAQRAAREAAAEHAVAATESARASAAEALVAQLVASSASTEVRLGEASRAHERVLAARSLESHRAQLADGEPCPLCGATEHPAAETSVASAVESDARARVAELTAELARERDAQAREAARALGHREAAETAAERASRWARDADAAWAELAWIAGESESESEGEGDGAIRRWALRVARSPRDFDRAETTALLAETQRRLEAREHARRAFAEVRAARDAARLAVAELGGPEASLDAARTESRARREALVTSKAELARVVDTLDHERATSRALLVGAGLPADPTAAARAIEARIASVATARARLAASAQELSRCARSLGELLAQMPRARDHATALGRDVSVLEQRIRTSSEEAARLVGSVGAEALALALDQALAAATARAANARDGEVRTEEQLARLVRELADGSHRLGVAQRASALAEDALSLALSTRGLDRATAERVLGPDREPISGQRAELSRLDAERASARARTEERVARRVAHEIDLGAERGDVGEELDRAILRARGRRDEARTAEGRSYALLEHDRAARVEASTRADGLGLAVAEEARWRALADVVGAADGKRFRVYAQALTLDRLLTYANAQLGELAPRYSLVRARSVAGSRAADGLALAVVDREAAETLRSVRSLSGGETFLVSLALALGLSEMTSERAPLGSLFLDEGFGALDPESLELALAALDGLRASGRQIAIVTHVPVVAERFAARVEVIPGDAGKSTVRVVAA